MKEGTPVMTRPAPIRMSIGAERMAPRGGGEIRMSVPSVRESKPKGLRLGEFKPAVRQVVEGPVRAGNIFETTKSFETKPPEVQSLPNDAVRNEKSVPQDYWVKVAREKKAEKIAQEKADKRDVTAAVITPRVNETIVPQEKQVISEKTSEPLVHKEANPNVDMVHPVIEPYSKTEIKEMIVEHGVPKTKVMLAQRRQTLPIDLIREALFFEIKSKDKTQGNIVKEQEQSTPDPLIEVAKDNISVLGVDVLQVERRQTFARVNNDNDRRVYTPDDEAIAERETMVAKAALKLYVGLWDYNTDLRYSGEDLADKMPSTPPLSAISKLAQMFGIDDGSWLSFIKKIKSIDKTDLSSLIGAALATINETRPVTLQSPKSNPKRALKEEVDLVLSGPLMKEYEEA
jgi:hypothetical protein